MDNKGGFPLTGECWVPTGTWGRNARVGKSPFCHYWSRLNKQEPSMDAKCWCQHGFQSPTGLLDTR